MFRVTLALLVCLAGGCKSSPPTAHESEQPKKLKTKERLRLVTVGMKLPEVLALFPDMTIRRELLRNGLKLAEYVQKTDEDTHFEIGRGIRKTTYFAYFYFVDNELVELQNEPAQELADLIIEWRQR